MLQQYLPLAVLKLEHSSVGNTTVVLVATVLTACGIETCDTPCRHNYHQNVATVLTACGIETVSIRTQF